MQPKKNYYLVVILGIILVCIWMNAVSKPSTTPPSSNSPKVLLNGKQISFDVPATIDNGQLSVPLKNIGDALSANVYWDGSTNTILVSKNGKVIRMQIGNLKAIVDSEEVQLGSSPKLSQGNTYIPLNFLCQKLNYSYSWDEQKQTATITDTTTTNTSLVEDQLSQTDSKVVGTYTIPDGTKFVGVSQNGQIISGTLNYQRGDAYTGKFINQMKDGYGSYAWSNGDKYVGEWASDKITGKGTYYFINGDKYEGSWNNGKMNGSGVYTFKNGQTLNGNWVNNEFQS